MFRGGATVEGGRELRRALRRAGADLSELKTAHSRVAQFVALAAAPRAPRRSGRLADSLRGNKAAARAVVTSTTPYGGPIHWGWGARGIDPQPFVAETAQATEPTWLGFYEEDVRQIVERIPRGA